LYYLRPEVSYLLEPAVEKRFHFENLHMLFYSNRIGDDITGESSVFGDSEQEGHVKWLARKAEEGGYY
jgi:hypothetical protein